MQTSIAESANFNDETPVSANFNDEKPASANFNSETSVNANLNDETSVNANYNDGTSVDANYNDGTSVNANYNDGTTNDTFDEVFYFELFLFSVQGKVFMLGVRRDASQRNRHIHSATTKHSKTQIRQSYNGCFTKHRNCL